MTRRPDGRADDRPADVDPATLEVLRNAFAAVAEEMTATLVRTAYSPNITERRDCSCAVFDADGAMVAQAETIPVHLGAMPFSVAAALDRFPAADLRPGDAILLNDPFHGGAHLPDLTLVTPVFAHGGAESAGEDAVEIDPDVTPIAYVANRAHHADVGGATAGSVGAESTEIFAEGVRIPPVKLRDGGDRNDAVTDLLLANVRTPDERRGDLRAQEAANATGRRRVAELVDEYGAERIRAAFGAVQEYSERRMRAAVRELPDGDYAFDDALDDDGHGTTDVTIAAGVEVADDELTVDFDGSAPQTDGPVNAVRAVIVSATYYAVRAVTDPEIPPNAGCYRPVTVRTTSGTVVDADPPAAVVGGNLETSQRTVDVVLGALAEAVPERVPAAGQGTMNNLTIGGTDPRDGTPYTFYETEAGGYGGRGSADGMDGVHVHMSNTLNTPIEALETAYPVRVERYALRPDSGGAGEYRGGLGLRRDITVRGPATVSVLADRQRHAPYGLAGGDPGEPGAIYRYTVSDGDDAERLPSKGTHSFDAGESVSLRTPGGGGYGDPDDRDPEAVRRDLRRGKISAERARETYGEESDEEGSSDRTDC